MSGTKQFCPVKLSSPNITGADVPNPVPNHSDPIQLPNFLLLDLTVKTEQHNTTCVKIIICHPLAHSNPPSPSLISKQPVNMKQNWGCFHGTRIF